MAERTNTAEFDAYVGTLPTHMRDPVRLELLALAQPYQPTVAEKKEEAELDRKLAFFDAYAEKDAQAKEDNALILESLKFMEHLKEMEDKHAADLKTALEKQKQELESKHEAELHEVQIK